MKGQKSLWKIQMVRKPGEEGDGDPIDD